MLQEFNRLTIKLNYLLTHKAEYAAKWHRLIDAEIDMIQQQLNIYNTIQSLPNGEIAVI